MPDNKINSFGARPSLLGLTVPQIAGMLKPLGQAGYRARQIYKWIHYQNVDSFEEMSNIPKSLRRELAERFGIKTLFLEQREIAADGTEKYLWKLPDGHRIESVLIPEARRNPSAFLPRWAARWVASFAPPDRWDCCAILPPEKL